jgi:hypothetical protein
VLSLDRFTGSLGCLQEYDGDGYDTDKDSAVMYRPGDKQALLFDQRSFTSKHSFGTSLVKADKADKFEKDEPSACFSSRPASHCHPATLRRCSGAALIGMRRAHDGLLASAM